MRPHRAGRSRDGWASRDGGGSVPTLWEYVRRLRQKLGDDPEAPRYLESERGIGYRLRAAAP